MSNIRKRGQKYQARVRHAGQRYEKTFSSLQSAERWVEQITQEFEQKTTKPETPQKKRFAQVIREYAKVYTPTKRGAANEHIIINRILRDEEWVQLPTYEITIKVLTKYRDTRLKTIKPSTFKREYAIIKHCAKVAKALGFDGVDVEVFANLPIPKVFDRTIPRITDADLEKLVKTAASGRFRAKYMPPLIKLAVDTGIRRGEMCKLVWSEIDFKAGIISLPAHKTKSGVARQVTFTVLGAEALRDLFVLATTPFKTKKVPSRNGPNDPVIPATADAVTDSWEHVRNTAGFPHLHFHDLRHEAISRMHEQGMTKPEIMDESGHSESNMLDRYSHSSIDRRRSIRGGLNND